MHMYGISNSSATFSPNLASLVRMAQEILDKIGQNNYNEYILKFYSLKGNCTGKLTFHFLHHLVVLVMYSAAAKFRWS